MQCKYRRGGFSLVELLVVVAVIAMMMTLMAPALSGFGGAAGRKGAVSTLMGVFEQARVAALEAGRPVYVVMWRRSFPEQDAVKVLRETEDGSGDYEQLSKWIKLPKGVILHKASKGDSMLTAGVPASSVLDASRLPSQVKDADTNGDVNYLVFSESGTVAFPSERGKLKLIVSEGTRESETETLRQDENGGFEIISVFQYTGRAQLDVSTATDATPAS